jgi:hypothetical protein
MGADPGQVMRSFLQNCGGLGTAGARLNEKNRTTLTAEALRLCDHYEIPAEAFNVHPVHIESEIIERLAQQLRPTMFSILMGAVWMTRQSAGTSTGLFDGLLEAATTAATEAIAVVAAVTQDKQMRQEMIKALNSADISPAMVEGQVNECLTSLEPQLIEAADRAAQFLADPPQSLKESRP